MIQFVSGGKDGKRDLIGFGLSRGNIERLMNGEPIYVGLDEIGLDRDCLIFFGETEQDMAEQLRPLREVHP